MPVALVVGDKAVIRISFFLLVIDFFPLLLSFYSHLPQPVKPHPNLGSQSPFFYISTAHGGVN